MEAKCRSARAQLWTSGVRLSIVMTKSIGLPVWKGYEEQPQMEAADSVYDGNCEVQANAK